MEIRALVESINSALIVREPGTARSAEAYEGLRQQVAQATSERRAHLIELTRLLEAIDNGVSGDRLRRLVAGWAEQAGLAAWTDTSVREYFEIIGEGEGDLALVNPAWVAGQPPQLIKPGLARRLTGRDVVQAGADEASTDDQPEIGSSDGSEAIAAPGRDGGPGQEGLDEGNTKKS